VKLYVSPGPKSTGSSVSFSITVTWENHPVVANVLITILDSNGQKVHEYVQKTSSSGIANEHWQIPDAASLGTYTIRVKTTKDSYVDCDSLVNFEVI